MMIDASVLEKIQKAGVIPVFCPKNQKEYETFRDAVRGTPLPAVEITLRSDFATTAIKRLKSELPNLLVGAGTVIDFEKLDSAIEVGADFCVSPGLSEPLITRAEQSGIPFLPGVSTPGEIQNALLNHMTVFKLFPAEALGGVKTLKLYRGAFSDAKFIPTGGITLDNLKDYQTLDNVIACGGSFMIPAALLSDGRSREIHDTILRCMRGN